MVASVLPEPVTPYSSAGCGFGWERPGARAS